MCFRLGDPDTEASRHRRSLQEEDSPSLNTQGVSRLGIPFYLKPAPSPPGNLLWYRQLPLRQELSSAPGQAG